MTLTDIAYQFSTEDECIAHYEKVRWPNGVACLECQSKRVVTVRSKSKKQEVRRIYQCKDCRTQFSIRSGTPFHDSHLPLVKWFLALNLIVEAKKGISAHQLARTIGVTYKTAWHMAHRIRKAMQTENPKPQGGVLEVDETYIGGEVIGKGAWKARQNKQVVIGIIKRGGDVRYEHVPNTKAKTIAPVLAKHVSPSAQMVVTDESAIYPGILGKQFDYRHQTICHKYEFVRSKWIHTNTIESAFSLLKRGYIGSFHQLSPKHLQAYLDEFEYRFNNRKNKQIFDDTLRRISRSDSLPYKELTGSEPF